MKDNQLYIDRAIALFSNLQLKSGFGQIYESVVIKQFRHKFEFSNIRIDDFEFSIGILHQRYLTTVIYCGEPNAFREDNGIGSVIYTIYAGKLAPRDGREFHANTMKLINNSGKKIPVLTQEIIRSLGRIELESPLPSNLNSLPIVEVLFNLEGKIVQVK